MEVTPEERRGAEIDYLKRYAPAWRASGGSVHPDNANKINISPEFSKEHPVFARLCEKYGAPDIGESKVSHK